MISTAAFAAIDAKARTRARKHLDRAVTFAGLSGDSETQYHVWNHQNGASLKLHQALLSGRDEEAVTLFVDLSHPKAVSLYKSWGYEKFDESNPYDDSPTFAVTLKRLKSL
ncbi:hypothetical protein [Streptomyces acidicola]|uniref:hypothetical protein n=1 Tax=Streptomyces acidicola TaxID=2596892 RepID=UPI0038239EE2